MRAKLSILLLVLCVSISVRLSAQEQVDATRQEASKLTKQDFPELLRKAEAGDAKAQLLLGEAYRFGYGVRSKDSEAVKWYRKAADQGNAVAQLVLSIAYQFGHGVHKDLGEAKVWCHKAAEQGLVEAEVNLGAIYSNENNYDDGATWTRKAAEHGSFHAQWNLADLYSNGRGVPQDHQTAYMWILLARVARCGQPPEICVEKSPEWDAGTRRLRDAEAVKLSPEKIVEARRRASDWLVAHQKEPLPAAEAEGQRAYFLVSHEHSGATFLPGNPGLRADYCFGWMLIDKGMIRYESRRGNDAWEIPFAQVKQVKMLGGGDAVQIQVETGKKYTVFLIDDRFERQNPEALLDALNKALAQK